MSSTHGGHRKHRKVYNTPYHAHCLTVSCYRRQAFFSGDLAPRWFLKCLDQARRDTPFSLWAFVVMPEHVHLIMAPGEVYNISTILARIKRPLTKRVVEWVQRTRPAFLGRMTERRQNGRVTMRFWQPGGGYDRNLWSPRHIHRIIRYVHEPPVRRGLVEEPGDWPWTSYRAWADGDPDPLPLDLKDLPVLLD